MKIDPYEDHLEWRPHYDGIMARAWLVNAIDEDRPTFEYCTIPDRFLNWLNATLPCKWVLTGGGPWNTECAQILCLTHFDVLWVTRDDHRYLECQERIGEVVQVAR